MSPPVDQSAATDRHRGAGVLGLAVALAVGAGCAKAAPSIDPARCEVTVDRDSAMASGTEVIRITVTIRDTKDSLMQGVPVSISATGSGNVIHQPEPTNRQGKTSGTLASTVAERKTVTVTAGAGAEAVPLPQQPTVEFTPSFGPPARLVFTVQPRDVVAGSVLSPAVAVTIQDADGNRVFTATRTIAVAISTNPGGGTLSGTTSASATEGVATFPDLRIDKVGFGYTLLASADGLSSATSAPFNVTAGPAAKVGFLVGPSDTVAGAAFVPPIQVAIQDALGNTVPNATGTVAVSIETNPAGGVLAGRLTEIANAGVATFSTLSIDRAGAGYVLRASSGGLAPGLSAPFTILPGALAKLELSGVPSPVTAGTPCAVTVKAQDALGNTIPSYAGTVAFTSSDAQAGLPEPYAFLEADQGVHTFSPGVTLRTAGHQTVAVSDLGQPGITGQAAVAVAAAPASRVRFLTPPGDTVAGMAFSPTVRVAVQDPFGNLITGSNARIRLRLGSHPEGSVLLGTAAVSAVLGVATFSDLRLERAATGYTLVAEADGLESHESPPFSVAPGPLARLKVGGLPAEPAAGEPFDLTVSAKDLFGNTVPTFTGAVRVTATDPLAELPDDYRFTPADQGSHTFSGTDRVMLKTAGPQTITATDQSDAAISGSQLVNVRAAAASQLFFLQPPTTTFAHAPFSPPVRVAVEDPFGNLVPGATNAITLRLGVNPSGALLDGASASAQGGIATFPSLSVDRPGTDYTLIAESPALASVESAPFSVWTAPPALFEVTGIGSNGQVAAGTSSTATLRVMDAYGYLVTGYSGVVEVTSTDAQATSGGSLLPVELVFTSGDQGVARIEVTLRTAGTQAVVVTARNDASLSGRQIVTVTPDVAAKLGFLVEPANVDVRVAIAPPVQVGVLDQFNNLVPTAAHEIDLTLQPLGGAIGTLTGGEGRTASAGLAEFANLRIDDEGQYRLFAQAMGVSPATSNAFTVTDHLPPGPVTDLAVISSAYHKIELEWTDPSEDVGYPSGLLDQYELRVSTAPIDQGNFERTLVATTDPATIEPMPTGPGSLNGAAVLGLQPGTTYYFALKAIDRAGNFSLAFVSGATQACPRGYAGQNCLECAVGFHRNSNNDCVDACTDPNPCPQSATCVGNVLHTYTASCTLTPTDPFFLCGENPPVDCAATANQICLAGECVVDPCFTSPCVKNPICQADGHTRVEYPATCTPTSRTTRDCSFGEVFSNCAESGKVCYAGDCQEASSPGAGDLVLSEILRTPLASYPKGEWFEVANVSGRLLDLRGLVVIETTGARSFTVSSATPVLVAASGHFVFGASGSAAENGGTTSFVNYPYGSVTEDLLPGAGYLKLEFGTAPAVLVDELDYRSGFPTDVPGTALNLSANALGSAPGHRRSWYWCAAQTSYGPGGLGTPGAANASCFTIDPPVSWCHIRWPQSIPSLANLDETTVYSRFWEPEVTTRNQSGNDEYPLVFVELGFGPEAQNDPQLWPEANWTSATFNPGYNPSSPDFSANNDELWATLRIPTPGSYKYAFRYRLRVPGSAESTVYCDRNGIPAQPAEGTYGTVTVVSTSSQIEAARNAADGTGLDLPIQGAHVTYLKPAVGSEPPGFFLQADPTGPALFVAVDPDAFTPRPAAGDRVRLVVTALATVSGMRRATALSGLVRLSQGGAVSGLVQDLSSAPDLVSALSSYESEIITVSGTIAGGFEPDAQGNGFVAAPLDTAGVIGSPDLKIRLQEELKDALEIGAGCTVRVSRTPLWRFNNIAKVSVWNPTELAATCAAPRVVGATAPSLTSVVVSFDRTPDPATVQPGGTQFSFTGGLVASAASANGKQVTLTTSAQLPGVPYTVTVDGTVKDALGASVDPAHRSAQFTSLGATELFLSEYGEGTSNNKWIEIFNGTGATVDLSAYSIRMAFNGATWHATLFVTFPSGTLLPNNATYVVCHSSISDPSRCSSTSSSLQFNGNDVVGLFKGSTLIDVVGKLGEAPDTGWPVCGTATATANRTLYRKATVRSPNIDWDASSAPGTCEWDVAAVDVFSGMGTHGFSP
jgi:hypothetical protein